MQALQADIARMIPSSKLPDLHSTASDPNPKQTRLVRELRRLMEELDELASSARRIISEAKSTASRDNIRPAVLRQAGTVRASQKSTPAVVDAVMFEPLFEKEMRKYNAYSQRVESIASQQSSLLEQVIVSRASIIVCKLPLLKLVLQEVNKNFLQAKQEDQAVESRERVLQRLDLAYHKYREISTNLTEGEYLPWRHVGLVNRSSQVSNFTEILASYSAN